MMISVIERMFMNRGSLLQIGLPVLLSCLFAASCAKTVEMEGPVQGQEQSEVDGTSLFTFTAYLDFKSRTQLGTGMEVLWSEGDKIRVFTSGIPEGVEFDLTDGEGTTKGTFSGPLPGEGPFYVLYPSQAAGQLAGSALSVTLPEVQEYAPGSFGPGANLAAGYGEQLDGIRFVNLAGAVSLTLNGDKTITGIRICGYDPEPLYGTAVIDGWDGATPGLSMDEGQGNEAFREIFLDCGTGVPLAPEGTDFHLVVPAGTLAGGYRIEVYDADGLAMVKYAKASEDNRVDGGALVQMPSLAYAPGYKAAWLRSDAVGAFANAAVTGELTAQCAYVKGRSQYAYLNTATSRYLRLEDWEDGYALGFTMPSTLTQGRNADVTVTSQGLASIPSARVEKMRVVKYEGDRVWMLDAGTGNGYILMTVED